MHIHARKNNIIECHACYSKLLPPTKSVSRIYYNYRDRVSSKQRFFNTLLVVGDCILVGLKPVFVYMSKLDGKFKFSLDSVNFQAEVAKVLFAVIMLFIPGTRHSYFPELKPSHVNVLLAVPAFLYAIKNYLKFTMQSISSINILAETDDHQTRTEVSFML
ncbi:hypothetical protein SAY86_005410 [Trapa natans]|uniref:Uncharacterized protein n=1 Tax=Trapa natans TaxID=22666 RepID=A0AAN7L953_TRANT|nr:hypothetical protein SAY86_005410 [Trapa natans]